MKSKQFGCKGFYGNSLNMEIQKNIDKVNILIIEYNKVINNLESFEEQTKYLKKFDKK